MTQIITQPTTYPFRSRMALEWVLKYDNKNKNK